MQRDGIIRLSWDVGLDVASNAIQGNGYDDLYNKRGYFEQKAHKSITPQIIETEFLPKYISKVDTNKLDVRKKIAEYYSNYFDRFQDEKEAQRRLKK